MSDTTVRLINLTDTALISEEELLDRAREGDRSAFGALYLRHRDAARKVAGMCATSAADADDAVAEGFARVFAALPRMAGRNITFRPYLLTAVRNAATDRLRRERRVDLRDSVPDTADGFQADDIALLGLERNLVGEALQALPSRWRTVLWLTEVEGLSPAEVSRRIGIKPNAVAALAYRARKGLREAYLQAHLRAEASEECRSTVSRLSSYVRGELPEKERLVIQEHLDACAKCRCRRDELTDVNATLRSIFLPVPLLLAGMQRRWISLFDGGAVWQKAPEVASVAQMADSSVTQKALAGITMAVLALTGATVPQVIDSEPSTPKVAVAAPAKAPADTGVPLAVGPLEAVELGVQPLTPATTPPAATSAGAASSSPQAAPAAEGGDAAAEGSRSRLLPGFGRYPEGAQRRGDTRQRLLPAPGGGGSNPDDGLLPGDPVSGVVDTALGAAEGVATDLGVDLGQVLPVEVGVTLPGPESDSGGIGIDVGVASAPAASESSADSGSAKPGLLGGVLGVVSGVLEPLGGLLSLDVQMG